MILPILTIAPSNQRGRGVFATESIAVGTTIEISPVLVVNPTERAELEKTILYDYIFDFGYLIGINIWLILGIIFILFSKYKFKST